MLYLRNHQTSVLFMCPRKVNCKEGSMGLSNFGYQGKKMLNLVQGMFSV